MKTHELLAAELLDHIAVGLDAVANTLRDEPERQLALKGAAMILRADAAAIVWRRKSLDRLIVDIRRPLDPGEIEPAQEPPTMPERPRAKRREE